MRNYLLLLLFLAIQFTARAQQNWLVFYFPEDGSAPQIGQEDSAHHFKKLAPEQYRKIYVGNGLQLFFKGRLPKDFMPELRNQDRDSIIRIEDTSIAILHMDETRKVVQIDYKANPKISGLKVILKSASFPKKPTFEGIGVGANPPRGKSGHGESEPGPAADSTAFTDDALGIDCACDKKHDVAYIEKMLDAKKCPECDEANLIIYDADCKTLYLKSDSRVIRIKDLGNVKFKYKKELKVKVLNVNLFLKDVAVTAEDEVYKSDAPSLFTNVFGAGSFINDLQASFDIQNGEEQDEIAHLRDELRGFLRDLNKLQARRERVYYQCCIPTWNCGEASLKEFDVLKGRLTALKMNYLQINDRINSDAGKETALKAEVKELDAEINELKKEKKPANSKEHARLLNAALDKKKAKDGEIAALNAPAERKVRLDKIWTRFKIPEEGELSNILIFNNNFLLRNYSYTTASIFPQGNRMTLKLTINSRDTNFVFKNGLQPTDHQEVSIEGPVGGQWTTSFSSGPFFAGSGSLYTGRYEFNRVPAYGNVVNDTSLYMLRKTGNTNPPIGLSAFAHFQRKWEGFGWGVSIGVGLTAESSPKLAYLVGPSLFFGNKSQFAITAGAAGMQVDVLKADLYPSYITYKAPQDLKYGKTLNVGYFVAITYTLFTLNKRNKDTEATVASTPPKN